MRCKAARNLWLPFPREFTPPPTGPPAQPVRTSIAAAQAIADMAPTLRGKVYEFIGRRPQGATRQEIADELHLSSGQRIKLQTVCGRCRELLDMGLIYQSAETRDSRKVLRITKH